jgi:hypothetical protein
VVFVLPEEGMYRACDLPSKDVAFPNANHAANAAQTTRISKTARKNFLIIY